MKLCGIIAEFNPLTNGHEYFLSQVKQKCNCDIAVIMSGNFSQRGEIAILDKYERASHAIACGADIVFELPTCFSLSSAQYFATGGVKILSDIGIDCLAFGVKTKNTDNLIEIAKLKSNEDRKISEQILSFMKTGQNYNRAFINTYKQSYPNLASIIEETFAEPNNILAIEYLSEIYRNNLSITPIFINREDSGYNTNKIKNKLINGKLKKMVNATHIRNLINSNKLSQTKSLVPSLVFKSIKSKKAINVEEKLDAIVLSNLRSQEQKSLEQFADFNKGLASLISSSSSQYSTRKEICKALESKCYRKSRINKLLLIPSFEIKKDFVKALDKPYAINVLAVSKSKKKLLSFLIKTSSATLVVSLSDLGKLTPDNSEFIKQNQKGTDIFNICSGKPKSIDKTIFV